MFVDWPRDGGDKRWRDLRTVRGYEEDPKRELPSQPGRMSPWGLDSGENPERDKCQQPDQD